MKLIEAIRQWLRTRKYEGDIQKTHQEINNHEQQKQIAWTLFYAGYDLTEEQQALLRIPHRSLAERNRAEGNKPK